MTSTKGRKPQDAGGYPQRPPFFAQRVIRAMTKTAAAQDIGPTAFALVALIAAQEDAKRYSGAVTYYNAQLLPLLGIAKWHTLDAARERAIKFGWLHYTPPPSGTRQHPGLYWTLIPQDAERGDDTPCDETDLLDAWYRRGFKDGYDAATRGETWQDGALPSPKNGYGRGDGCGYGRGYGMGAPSYPIPIPNPVSCSELASTPTSKPDDPAPGFEPFPCDGPVKTWTLPAAKLAEWSDAYPHLDVTAALREARQWIIDNPQKRKTARGMVRFLGGWLGRAQNNGHGTRRGDAKPAGGSIYKQLKPI